MTSTFTLTADDNVSATVSFVDKYGNPVPAPSGVPTWTVDNSTVLGLVPAGNGLSAELNTVGPAGSANVIVALGVVTGEVEITVTPGAVANVSITMATPTLKA